MLPAYREYRPPVGLESVVACLWENEPDEDRTQRVVPDGCVDLIWVAERELVIAGADTGPRSADLAGRTRLSGIRLRPGAAGAVLGLPAVELRDRQVSVSLVWGEQGARLEEAVACAEPRRRLELLAAAVAGRDVESDGLVLAAARRLPLRGRASQTSRRSSALASASSTDVCSPLWGTGQRCLPGSLVCDDWWRLKRVRWFRVRLRLATRARPI